MIPVDELIDLVRAYNPKTDEALLRGAKRAIESSEYLPTLKKMIDCCQGDMESHGLPSAHNAYIEACRAPSPKSGYNWSHPAVYHAGKMSDWHFIGNNTERTALDKAWWETGLYALGFPFEQLYHLLPWGLFVLFLFRKGTIKSMWQHPFLRFAMVVLAVNVLPYIFSPDTRPRYLFMLYPLLLLLLGHAFFTARGIGFQAVRRVHF